MNLPGFCTHGWSLETLRDQESLQIEFVKACEQTAHPFRAEMLAGAQKRLATVREHIAEAEKVRAAFYAGGSHE